MTEQAHLTTAPLVIPSETAVQPTTGWSLEGIKNTLYSWIPSFSSSSSQSPITDKTITPLSPLTVTTGTLQNSPIVELDLIDDDCTPLLCSDAEYDVEAGTMIPSAEKSAADISSGTASDVQKTPSQQPGVLQRLYNKVSDVVSVTKRFVRNAGSNVINGRLEVYGRDINPAHHTAKATKGLYRWAKGITVPSPTDVLDNLSAFRQELDTRLGQIPAMTASGPVVSPTPSTEDSFSVDSTDNPMKLLIEEEEREKTKFLTNITNFASFRFFHETIMGYKPEDTMAFYKKILNSENPNQALYQEYGFLGGLFARILVPIFQWVIGLIFSTRADKLSGISAVKEVVSEYLKNKENVRNEIKECFSTASDYFYKLHCFEEQFVVEGRGETLEQFLKRKLNEDLEKHGLSRESLYQGLNTWVVEVINIKTDIPIIGCIIDKIISAIMKPVLNKMNLVQSAIEKGFGSTHPNPAFIYNVKSMIANKLKEYTEKLKALPPNTATRNEGTKKPLLTLTTEEKEILKQLYSRLIRHLPFEGANEEDIPSLLAQEKDPTLNKTRFQRLEGVVVDWDKEISKNLEGPFNDLFVIIYGELAKPENRMGLLVKMMKSANQIFSEEGSRTYTPDDLERIHKEALNNLTELTDTLLDRQFDEEILKKRREKDNRIIESFIRQTKESIQESVNKLNSVQQDLDKVGNDTHIEEIEASLYKMLKEVNELFNITYNRLSECDKIQNMKSETKEIFVLEMQELLQQMRQAMGVYDESLQKVRSIKAYGLIQASAEALQARENYEDDDNDFASIIPGVDCAEISRTLNHISDRLPTANDSQSSLVQENVTALQATKSQIDTANQLLAQHDKTSRILGQVMTKLQEIHTANEAIRLRPDEAARTTVAADIASLKRISHELRSISPITPEFSTNVDEFITLRNRIASRLSHYPEIVNGSLASYISSTAQNIDNLRQIQREAATNFATLQANSNALKALKQQVRTNADEITSTNLLEAQLRNVPTLNTENTREIESLTAQMNEIDTELDNHLFQQSVPVYKFQQTLSHLIRDLSQPSVDRRQFPTRLSSMIHSIGGEITKLNGVTHNCLEHRRELRSLFDTQTSALNTRIQDRHNEAFAKIRAANLRLTNSLIAISDANERLQAPVRISFNPGSAQLAKFEKQRVKERVRAMQSKIYAVVTNPMHIEQFLLRGPLTRLVNGNPQLKAS